MVSAYNARTSRPDEAVKPARPEEGDSPVRHCAACGSVVGLKCKVRAMNWRTGLCYCGVSSVVVARRLPCANPLTYLIEAGEVYFSAYAALTDLSSRSLRTRAARTGISFVPWRIAPSGSSRKAKYQPLVFMYQDLTKTRPSTTTLHIPVNLCAEPEPARIQR